MHNGLSSAAYDLQCYPNQLFRMHHAARLITVTRVIYRRYVIMFVHMFKRLNKFEKVSKSIRIYAFYNYFSALLALFQTSAVKAQRLHRFA